MALPDPPEGEPRQVLQAIWDHASETGKWPAFAQLDRRWDRNHESDVLEILRQVPRGLLTGRQRLQHATARQHRHRTDRGGR